MPTDTTPTSHKIAIAPLTGMNGEYYQLQYRRSNAAAGSQWINDTAYSDNAGKTAIGAATNVNLGSFKTAQEGTASNIAAPAVNKITASINNSGVLNIGWVAPANYTGTYTVGVEKWNGTAWGTVTGTVITPGKTAATLANQTAGYFRITVRAADGPVTATAPAAIFGIGTSSL